MLRTFQGEYFLNTQHGIPYWDSILGKKTSKSSVDLIFQQKILAERGVKEITYFKSTLENRKYYLSVKVKVSTGDETELITVSPTN